ncbi:MAG: glycosyltransferase family 4 protein [Planctomycetia bacterium]|nr:glycosyltransferase family 4 protein [Planctomycetia bacterium]
MEVITNVHGKPGGFWGDSTTFVGPPPLPALCTRWLGKRWLARLQDLLVAVRLYQRRAPDVCFVTGGGLDGRAFALLQALLPWKRSRHVLVDCNWYRARWQLLHWLRCLELKLATKAVEHFVVWASHEIEDYARAFGLPASKFRYVPFHTTLDRYQFAVRDDGYLFAGGNYDRDYATLVEAVRPVNIPVWIATTLPEQLRALTLPAHVRVEGTTKAGFRDALAGARLTVVPMQDGLLHSGGQQTCLNAMWMGKPTIAVGRRWARDLMEDGVHGMIVDYGDVAGLREAIRWIIGRPDQAAALARRGQQHAQQFTTRRCMETIWRLAVGDEFAADQTGWQQTDAAALTDQGGELCQLPM